MLRLHLSRIGGCYLRKSFATINLPRLQQNARGKLKSRNEKNRKRNRPINLDRSKYSSTGVISPTKLHTEIIRLLNNGLFKTMMKLLRKKQCKIIISYSQLLCPIQKFVLKIFRNFQ